MTTRVVNAFLAVCLVLFLFSSAASADDNGTYKFFDSYYTSQIAQDWIGIVDPVNPNYTTLGTGSTLLKSDDGYLKVDLPFSVNFFDDMFNSCYILANGVVTFSAPVGKGQQGLPFPAENLSNAIAPFWTDISPRDEFGFGFGEII